MSQRRIVVVAALQREVARFVRGWKRCENSATGIDCYVSEQVVVACAGMGASRAVRALDAGLQWGPARAVLSVGWAGACTGALGLGEIVQAEVVIDARTGERFFPMDQPKVGVRGAVVTVSAPASVGEKQRLLASYGAAAVEMEAAAVARVACARDLPFAAVKAISDDAGFEMPDISAFVTKEGQMQELAFGLHVAVRPVLWRPVMRMAAGSKLAAERLSEALQMWVEQAR